MFGWCWQLPKLFELKNRLLQLLYCFRLCLDLIFVGQTSSDKASQRLPMLLRFDFSSFSTNASGCFLFKEVQLGYLNFILLQWQVRMIRTLGWRLCCGAWVFACHFLLKIKYYYCVMLKWRLKRWNVYSKKFSFLVNYFLSGDMCNHNMKIKSKWIESCTIRKRRNRRAKLSAHAGTEIVSEKRNFQNESWKWLFHWGTKFEKGHLPVPLRHEIRKRPSVKVVRLCHWHRQMAFF